MSNPTPCDFKAACMCLVYWACSSCAISTVPTSGGTRGYYIGRGISIRFQRLGLTFTEAVPESLSEVLSVVPSLRCPRTPRTRAQVTELNYVHPSMMI